MTNRYIVFTTLVGIAGALIGTVLTIGAFYVLLQLQVISMQPTQIVFPKPTGSHGGFLCDKRIDGTYYWGIDHPSYPDSYCPPWPAMATP